MNYSSEKWARKSWERKRKTKWAFVRNGFIKSCWTLTGCCMWSEEPTRQKKYWITITLQKSIKGTASDVVNYKYHIKTNELMKTNNAGGVRLNDLNVKKVEIMGQTVSSIDLKQDIISFINMGRSLFYETGGNLTCTCLEVI